MSKIEVFRLLVPHNKLINDNSGQHYRILAGKSKWLASNARNSLAGEKSVGGFTPPSKEEVLGVIDPNDFTLILEHWKCNRSFDLANYEMTFKPIIDVFSSEGYWADDAWKYLDPVIFTGGDYSVWDDRPFRYESDGLPENIRKDWWVENFANPFKDSLIRVIASKKIHI